jgi:hypothetical protein
MNIQGYQKLPKNLTFDKSISMRSKREFNGSGSESPIRLPTINTDLYSDFSDRFHSDFKKMYLNEFPTKNRREFTKSKIFQEEKAKMAALERIRASFAANIKAENERLEKVYQAKISARYRSSEILT